MADQKDYTRQPQGSRFVYQGGMNIYRSVDLLNEGEYAYLQNVRRYLDGRIRGRATMGSAVYTLSQIPNTIRRLNDSTPAGPVGGYVRVIGAGGLMYVNATQYASGLSGNPMSLVPFRPNASVEPWMYSADSAAAPNVVLSTKFAIDGTPDTFHCAGMLKTRSDGLMYKMGIKEPQSAPVVSTSGTTTSGTDALPATTIPWTNVGGVNPSYNYGHTNGADGTAPVIISTPAGAQTLQLTVTGTATVNGATHAPGDAGPTGGTYPANYISAGGGSPTIVLGAFTDGSGNVLAGGGPVPIACAVGAAVTLTVPSGAAQFQVGIDSSANTFSANSGSFSVNWVLTSSAIATKISTLGNVTTYYWGDSPHSGPVAEYIWKNPNDSSSSGTPRTTATAAGTVTNNSWQFDSTPEDGSVPMLWDTLDSSGTVVSSIPVFTPALESNGYQDFNMCVVGTLFVPTAGTYVFTFVNKDQILVGIGGGATSDAATKTGPQNQTETVVSALPLIYASVPNGGGGAVTQSMNVIFPASGSYQIEIDYDYWYHTGRKLKMTINGAVVPPIPSGARTNTSYACKYRSSLTGAVSNPGPASDPQVIPVLDNTVECPYSDDPQVDKVDYYRQDASLANYTYVATGPNTNPPTPITDTLSDADAATNNTMDTDDFEPFPSIDLPRSGHVNVSGGIITWVDGDQFNTRWLAGTIIEIGYPTQLAYSLYTRPTSATTMFIPGVPDGTDLVYNIPEPILAAQPLPSIWGPTDNTAYMFGCGDPLRPGTLYFTKGNNPDSAPDTNQIEVTSPSEPLMNGVIVNGIGMVFSTEHAWLIYPTYTTALAFVSSVQGQPFNMIQSITNRGLYIRTALCTEAGLRVFFRAKDGIYVSAGGSGSESITDEGLYNLFPHEGFTPSPVTIGSFTVYPPDDTNPEAQKLSFANGYLYYDYKDSLGNPRTLVYDVAGKGWSVDVGNPTFSVHALDEGPNVNDTVVGCSDNTVRVLQSGGTEVATSVIATGSVNAGDARAFKRLGDVYIKALVAASNPITVALYADRYQTVMGGFSPTSLTGTGTLKPYIVDFTSGHAFDLIDVAAVLSWNTSSGTIPDFWQPDFIPLPESTQDRPTDWDDGGNPGNKFVQGMMLEADTFNVAKTFSVQRSDDLAAFTPNEAPVTFNGQTIKPFTFTPPFLAHSMRIVSTDGVPWNHAPGVGWRMSWVFVPYPESTVEWQTEMISHQLRGFQHIRAMNIAHASTADLTLTLVFDQWPTITLTIPNSGGSQTKTWVQIPPNKFKLVSYRISSSVPFFLWQQDIEVYVKWWGDTDGYQLLKPFGGPSGDGAAV